MLLENLKPYTYRFNKNIFSFTLFKKECILIPFPHKDMNHNFLLDHHYEGLDYHFSILKEETMINFFGTEKYNKGNRYNIFLLGHYIVVPLSKISELAFCQTPNSNFTYLVAISM